MLMGDLAKKRVIICCELVARIIPYYHHLDFFHVVSLMHGHRDLIYSVEDGGLVGSGVEPPLVDLFEDLVSEFVALLEAGVIRANEYYAQVGLFKADVHVQHEFLTATWEAHRRPSLSILQ